MTISSVRGSPGATSWALLLAAAWPSAHSADRIVVEADCSGGVLGARYGLGVDPGAVSLVSACRRSGPTVQPAEHGRRAGDHLWIVPGPESAEQAVPVWRSGAADVASTLRCDRRLWLVDIGRSGPDDAARDLAEAAAVNLLVVGSSIEDIVQAPARVASLARSSAPGGSWVGVLLVGRPDHPERELHRFLGGRALWVVPAVDGLPGLAIKAVRGGRARRSAVWRAAVEVAADLSTICRRSDPHTPPHPKGPPSARAEGGPSQNGRPARQRPVAGPPPEDGSVEPAIGVGFAADPDRPSVAIRAAAANAYRLEEAAGD